MARCKNTHRYRFDAKRRHTQTGRGGENPTSFAEVRVVTITYDIAHARGTFTIPPDWYDTKYALCENLFCNISAGLLPPLPPR